MQRQSGEREREREREEKRIQKKKTGKQDSAFPQETWRILEIGSETPTELTAENTVQQRTTQQQPTAGAFCVCLRIK